MRARRLQAQLRLISEAFGRTAFRPPVLGLAAVLTGLGACAPVELTPPQLDLQSDPGPPVDPLARNPDAPVIVRNGKGEVLAEMHPGKSGDASANPPLSAFDGTLVVETKRNDGSTERQTVTYPAGQPVKLRRDPATGRYVAEAARPRYAHPQVTGEFGVLNLDRPNTDLFRREQGGVVKGSAIQQDNSASGNLREDRRRIPAQPRRPDVKVNAGLSRPPRRVPGIDVDVLARRHPCQRRPVRHLHAGQRHRHRTEPARRHLFERIPGAEFRLRPAQVLPDLRRALHAQLGRRDHRPPDGRGTPVDAHLREQHAHRPSAGHGQPLFRPAAVIGDVGEPVPPTRTCGYPPAARSSRATTAARPTGGLRSPASPTARRPSRRTSGRSVAACIGAPISATRSACSRRARR